MSSKSDPKERKTVSKRVLNSHKSAKWWHKGCEIQHISMAQRTERSGDRGPADCAKRCPNQGPADCAKRLQYTYKYVDVVSIPLKIYRCSIRMDWKWVRIDGKGYANTTHLRIPPLHPKTLISNIFRFVFCRFFMCFEPETKYVLMWIDMN